LLVVENPATSSPGLSFLMATIAVFGETGDYTYLDFWRDLAANDVLVVDGWEDAYYGQFSGGSGEGDRPIVVSYATSPAAEVFFADPQPAESPTGNLFLPGGSTEQVEFVGILAGAKNLSWPGSGSTSCWARRSRPTSPADVGLPGAHRHGRCRMCSRKHAQEPTEIVQLTPEQIEAGREGWLNAWTDTVLR
jgi:thiamine transport system substrate-binding protein